MRTSEAGNTHINRYNLHYGRSNTIMMAVQISEREMSALYVGVYGAVAHYSGR